MPSQRPPADLIAGDLTWPGPATLPVPRSSFIGRGTELARGGELLRQTRLLTLLGPGGCGKTRLAIRLAADHRAQFPGGTFFVDLGPLARDARVIDQLALSMGIEEPERGSTLAEVISRQLGVRPTLAVLDNCEHLVDDVAAVADTLLSGAPGLTILATSRTPLSVEGELTWTVPAMSDEEARDLFHARATSVRPERPLGATSEAAVLDICHRLDGLPLSIELAAARTRTLSPVEISEGLEKRFELLAKGPRSAASRHATLRARMVQRVRRP